MAAAAVRKTHAVNVASHSELGLPGPSKRHATCAWCRRDRRSIVELVDRVEAAHLDQTDPTSEASATCSTKAV
jgi:hypothetical protein